ncbi:acyl-CoA thioesterase [Halorubellus sp. JP-L1]|uniref:acyl-CoA thioesterase n=1 Tax=Halorubellus sp. JP-L1 TaxID=2715753 RepID=UPI00140DC0AD|nr:acyl-CoA thioesterase [Halorubellus sp. JP-L1]NHN43546.1 acyl-CoA thioesterase [Halorubellus sp. JP-L1]
MPALSETYIENRQRVQPNHANNYESVHGGNLMKWMDEVGAMSAMRFAGETCVTAGVDEFSFERPIPVGEIAVIEAYVFGAGRSSVRVFLRAYREDPLSGERAKTTEACFTYVAVDADGRSTTVPELDVESANEEELLTVAERVHG